MKLLATIMIVFLAALAAQAQYVFRCVDIFPNNGNASPSGYFVYQDKIFMSARTSGFNMELYTSNGTAAGTQMLKDLNTGISEFSVPKDFTPCNGKLFFLAFTDATGLELWTTDGTATGTQLVKDINPGANGCGTDLIAIQDWKHLIVFQNKVYFLADDGVHGQELWVSDGTTAGTTMVKDINPGTEGSYPIYLKAFNESLVFQAYDPSHGVELWVSNGTAAGTQMLKDINPGTEHSNPGAFMAFKGKLYFNADNGVNGNELWVSDGTVAGTQMLKDIDSGPANSGPGHYFEYKSKLYFSAGASSAQGYELWVSDGTSAGTQLFKDINPGMDNSEPQNFVVYKDKLYFSARGGAATGTELWVTDGTVAATAMVKDLNPGMVPSNPSGFLVHKDKLYFIITLSIFDERLAVSDGTAAGTMMIQPPTAHLEDPLFSSHLIAYHDTLYFRAFFDNAHGEELWALSDTSATNTGIVPVLPDNFYSLYPNPGKGAFTLQMTKPASGAITLHIYDITGRKVHTQTIARGASNVPLALFHLNKGVYITKLQTDDGSVIAERLVIE
ncbi:MAG: ELWxxDGT repeat protein [Taibaiella sp.]|jgi:ELWxxDGT repeat protein